MVKILIQLLIFFAALVASDRLVQSLSDSGIAGKSRIISKDGVDFTLFEHYETGAQMEYVSNSGVCESTPKVKQYSGYINIGTNTRMWFWFFEARKNPQTAPLVAWFNGGPGCSSMIGLFQENGPCTFNNGEPVGKPSLNTQSFNSYANMIYIDQPSGVGFSAGEDGTNSTTSAAPAVWKLLQGFYTQFPEYKSRDFGIFTESYGGHYGPGFAKYILDRNALISKGSVKGQTVNLVALGVNNGWINPYDSYKGMIDFAADNNHKNLINKQTAKQLNAKLTNNCLPALKTCWQSGTNSACSKASMVCKNGIESRIAMTGSFNVYDVRKKSYPKFPPQTYEKYLQQPAIMKKIGAGKKFNECPRTVQQRFSKTGDDSRNYIPVIESLLSKNVTVLIWAGDADWICNWKGNLYTANSLKYPGQGKFKSQPMVPYKVNGKAKGAFKTVDNLSYLRVYNAGHTVMAYQGPTALQAFTQTMQRKPISST